MTAAKRKAKIPRFRTDAEKRAFWACHSVDEFAGNLEDLDVAIRPARTEQIAVRLYKDDLDALQSLAAKHGVGHYHLGAVTARRMAGARAKRTAPGTASESSPARVGTSATIDSATVCNPGVT